MKIRLQKWAKSLFLRIPTGFADKARLQENSPAEVTLDVLVEQITEKNRRDEIETGQRLGLEIW